jgi:hypothetical protein
VSSEPQPPPAANAGDRRPGRLRRWIVRPFVWGFLLLLSLLAAGLLLLQSQFARERALARIVAQMTELLGRPVVIGDIDYTFFPMALELRDVVIPGPGPADPPVARAPSVRIQMTVKDLQGRVFDLEQIDIEHPVIHLRFNPDGTDNLPRFRTRRGGPKRFDVRIGRILVMGGILHIDERKVPLEVDARAVWGRLIGRADREDEGGSRLDGLVTAQEVVTILPRARPYRFTLSAKGTLEPAQGRVRIVAARVAGPDLSGRANGFVDYRSGNRRVELALEGQGGAQLANRLGYLAQPIAGPVSVGARFEWTPAGWSYSGTATSPRIAALDRVIEDVRASFLGDRDHLDVDLETARYARGTVAGLIAVETGGEGAGPPVSLDLEYADLSIHQLIADQFPGGTPAIVGGISGRARGTLEYRFNTEATLAGSGRADVEIRGTTETGLPIAGRLPLRLDRGVVTGRDLHLTAPGQEVFSPGFTYDLVRGGGRIDFRLESRDVGPLGPLLAGAPNRGEEPDFWLPSEGRGTAEGAIELARGDYSLQLRLALQDVVAPVTTADAVRGSLVLNPRAVEDLRLELTRGGGALVVTGRIPLPTPGGVAAPQPIALAVDAAQWPAAALAWFLGPELARNFDGELSGRVDLSGVPDRLNGRVDARVEELSAFGVPLGRARAAVAFDGGLITVEQGRMEMPAGTVLAQGSFNQETEALRLTARASSLSLAAAPFNRYLGGDLTGSVSVEASAAGTLREPRATVALRGRDLVLQGRTPSPQGDTVVQATWDGRRAEVSGSLLGLVSFAGGGRLDRRGADLAIDLRSDQLGLLTRALATQPLPEFSGSLAGTTTLAADFGPGSFRAGLELPELRLRYQGRTIAAREPVVADLDAERVTLRSLYMGEPGTDNELFVSGTVGLSSPVPLNLQFQSTIAASWAELFLPDYRIEGALDVLGAVRGTAASPQLSGQGEIRGARAIVPDLAQAFEDVHAFLSFNRDRIFLDQATARLGGGTLRASGTLDLPTPGAGAAYRLNVSARDISLRLPEFLLNRGNAEVALISSDLGRQIVGQIDLERSLYVEDVPVDLVQFIQRAFERQRLELAETGDFESTTQLNLAVRGPDALRVRNNVANLQGDVSLTVRGTLARPVIFGEVDLDPGGTLVFADNEYEVQRGSLTFSNPNRIDPVVDLVAQTEVQGFNITLNLGGTLERPDVSFASDANLADLEIVSLIATGQRPGEGPLAASPADEELAPNLVARQFLYGQAATAISQRVGTIFRFDRFRIDPVVEAGQPVSGIGVTVGKRLSRDVFVTYSTEPNTNRQYIVQVEWRLRQNVILVLTQAGDGSYAIDAQLQRRF